MGFAELSNGFASCEHAALLQRICGRFGPGHVQVWFDRWMAVIPLPLNAADRAGQFTDASGAVLSAAGIPGGDDPTAQPFGER